LIPDNGHFGRRSHFYRPVLPSGIEWLGLDHFEVSRSTVGPPGWGNQLVFWRMEALDCAQVALDDSASAAGFKIAKEVWVHWL
jgi:hypothetical protein